ncbi:uncharacterized protein LOC111004677 isoform X2 [Momordica charantia]|uniref:Uncharacterized protein LOC111004677 isoform X2 n=1 Tax=Momordica charantia TaxID=3673 RepID=A0A6J1BPM9_MOMCH|nr:uncharacterized protein LOC111004677 isoform X2 [Momordica charantia]
MEIPNDPSLITIVFPKTHYQKKRKSKFLFKELRSPTSMAERRDQVDIEDPPARIPLLESIQSQNSEPTGREDDEEAHLDSALQLLDVLLAFLGFHQSSVLSCALSWTGFVLVGIVLPVVVLQLTDCATCEKYQIKDFELDIVASQACLAAVSLLCLSHNLRKYGIKRFLTVDRQTSSLARFRKDYVEKILGSIRLLVFWALACFILKAVREVIRILYAERVSWGISIAILLAMTISWTYVSLISISTAIVFHLMCNLQLIHFDDYAKLLQTESEVLLLIEEHIFLRYHLSKISHRFRIFLLLQFLVVTASQFMTLFQTTGYSAMITLINGGDFAVSAIVQVVGVILCLHGATKISHRAQGTASVASRWHALVTCGPGDVSQPRHQNGNGNSDAPSSRLNSMTSNYSESDLESLDILTMPTTTQLASYMTSYHKRQAFVMYLQMNPGGITIFGWTVDRALMNTIFFIELTLVTFVLGKTIVFS